MKAVETIQDLIEEAKLRTVWWALCIFLFTYFLSHTSTSMWMNLPISVLLISALRVLSNEVEFRWKVRDLGRPQSYLYHLEKKQLSVSDSLLTTAPPPSKWKRKIDSLIVEATIGDFIDKLLKDFVVDLWYSDITPDREVPELMRSVIMDAIGEISGRVKEINLVDLLTRDVVNLIGDHLDLFRRNQAAIGVDVMLTLSTEERDKRLKHHLMNTKELHPALVSPDSEYKVLKRLISGLLAILLRPQEAQCPLVRVMARELVTCLVMQPVMDLASPRYTNELIESILLAIMDDGLKELGSDNSTMGTHGGKSTSSNSMSLNYQRNGPLNDKGNVNFGVHYPRETPLDKSYLQEHMQPRPAEWARKLEVATQRRTEILAPENLESMWTKGRNYKRKENKKMKPGVQQAIETQEALVQLTHPLSHDGLLSSENKNVRLFGKDGRQDLVLEKAYAGDQFEISNTLPTVERKSRIKRSNSTSALEEQLEKKMVETGDTGGKIDSEFYSPNFCRHREDNEVKKVPDIVLRNDGSRVPKLKCRVVGAYFEKIGSKSFAVYSIAVTDVENRTWFVKRRYRNFERLHRHLKDIPNYTLHLPPKRIFSSSTEDAFVHQRCIQLDKYLQDLSSIANVTEQHEVWDFLSVSSKNYSFGKSSSIMRTLVVNVDDAVDDIVRQFKGVSDGVMQTIVGSSSQFDDANSSMYGRNLSCHADDMNRYVSRQEILETVNSNSDYEESNLQDNHGQDEDDVSSQANGWHSDNELNSKGFPPRVIKHDEEPKMLDLDEKNTSTQKSDFTKRDASPAASALIPTNHIEDPVGMPPEWTPSNVSVPLLNLVDKAFQLNRRGWLRRQVFWISKQILQLIMEDAIDDWLLQQIFWVRREETVAQGIRWVKDVLWPGGTFFTSLMDADDSEQKLTPFQVSQFGGNKASRRVSFEEQLEAARRVSNIKKMLFDGAPAALVSLIGHKQYRRCARDIFYFTQSTICLKQLAYAILELLLVSVFPELRDLVLELHENTRVLPE